MQKLVWWLSIIIAALVNEVQPYHMQEVTFQPNSYYVPPSEETADLRTIYNSFFAGASEDIEICNPSPLSLPATGDEHYATIDINNGACFFIPHSDVDPQGPASLEDCKTFEIGEDDIYYLVAPLDCKITTTPSESNYSTEMVVEVQLAYPYNYSIGISNMECWYCCIGHTKIGDLGYQHAGVKQNSYSYTIRKGQVLGLANSNTTIRIQNKDGEYLTFDEFYDQVKLDKKGKIKRQYKTPLDYTYASSDEWKEELEKRKKAKEEPVE